MAGLASPRGANTNLSLKTGIVALISVYNFGFCSGWAPLSHSVSAEVPGSELRDYTWRVANGANILLQYVHPRPRVFVSPHNGRLTCHDVG